jgi:hypothetical protein
MSYHNITGATTTRTTVIDQIYTPWIIWVILQLYLYTITIISRSKVPCQDTGKPLARERIEVAFPRDTLENSEYWKSRREDSLGDGLDPFHIMSCDVKR